MSHVKGHFRNVDGKLVWVAEHEREGAPGHKASLFGVAPAPAPAPAPEPVAETKPVDTGTAGLASGTDLGAGMAAPESKEALTKQHFQDVGKKIGGAAKDMAALKAKYFKQKLAVSLDDLEDMEAESPELAHQLLTKEQQLGSKSDFLAQMKNQGATPGCAYIAGRLYTAIGDPVDTPAGRKAFALGLKRIQEALSTWKTPEDAAKGLVAISDEVKGFWLPAEDEAKRQELLATRMAAKKAWQTAHASGVGEHEALAASKAAYDAYWSFYKEAEKKADADPNNPKMNLRALGQNFEKMMKSDARIKDAFKKGMEIEKTVGWGFIEKKAGEAGEQAKEKVYKPWHGWVKPESETVEKEGSVASGIFVAQTLKDVFGMSGIEYGNWMDKDASQHHTQACGEALMDMAHVLGIDPKEMSLNGRLSLAFGARGKGKAKAHYEPAKKAINLTKMAGGGSLAHEWGHAMDNIMAMVSTGGKSHQMAMMTANDGKAPGTELPAEVEDAFKAVHAAIHGGTFQLHNEHIFKPNPSPKATLNYQGKQILDAVGGDPQAAMDAYAAKIDYMKKWKPKKHASMLKKAAQLFADASGKSVMLKVPTGQPTSHFAATGEAMGEYWGRKEELFARAWESFVMDKMTEKGMKNTYLVSGVGKEHAEAYGKLLQVLEPVGGKTSIYPLGEERAAINAAFEKLVGALNNHKMFSKALAILKRGLFD